MALDSNGLVSIRKAKIDQWDHERGATLVTCRRITTEMPQFSGEPGQLRQLNVG
jgi:hypothetical protein